MNFLPFHVFLAEVIIGLILDIRLLDSETFSVANQSFPKFEFHQICEGKRGTWESWRVHWLFFVLFKKPILGGRIIFDKLSLNVSSFCYDC